jgi:hypothetical protein
MFTGVKQFRAVFVVGALLLSLYTPKSHAEVGNASFGVAAITAAANGIAIPAIQAGAQISIAQTNAATSTYLNSLSAATQAYSIGASTMSSMFNTLSAMRIASMNNQKDLTQTYMLTSFQAWDRNQNYQLQSQQMAFDNYYRSRKLELESMLAQAQLELAQTQFNASLVSQGLAPGFRPVSSLAVQNVNQPQTLASYASTSPMMSINPNSWAATGLLKSRAGALASAFRGVASLASGSTPHQKVKGDIRQFLEAKSVAGTFHQPKGFAADSMASTHTEGGLRALRSRPLAQ